MTATTSTATARPPYGPPVRRVAFGAIEPQGHRVGLFGPGGIGKTTLAATAPGPVGFIDLDDSLPILRPSLGELDIRRVSGIAGWQDIRDALHSDGWDDVRTIVLDSATKAEELALEWTLRNVRHEKEGVVVRRIEDYGFGKGYQHLYETFLTLLSDLDQHVRAGRNVVLICHDCTATVPNPKGEDYIRWEPRLQNPSSGKASIRLQVASVQTLVRRDKPPAGLVVVDECHHAAAETYQNILGDYGDAALIGLTATPFRLDGRGLGDLFGELVVAAWPDELCTAGVLHKPRVWASKAPDLRGVRVVAGDYSVGALAERTNTAELNADIVQTWRKRADGKRTVVFAVDIEHSEAITEAFRQAGVAAEHLDGGTARAERDAILDGLASGRTLVVSNCMVLTEGWDLPALECAVIARPTASLNLHLQMIGRVMRACDGKDGALVLDHAGTLRTNGKAQLFNAGGHCSECCTPYVLASYTTNGSSNPTWNLTPYQGEGKAKPCAFWRLIETGSCYPYSYPWYGFGCVDHTGRLVGLPDSFTSHYYYNGYMQLQIGCRSASGTQINWPGTCQTTTSVYSC